MKKTLRFWINVHGSPVKLSLRDDDKLQWSAFEQTDEGWSSEFECWTREGGIITRYAGSDGRDCDGRLSASVTLQCPWSLLNAGYREDGIAYPEWKEESRAYRDYQAEAAGY